MIRLTSCGLLLGGIVVAVVAAAKMPDAQQVFPDTLPWSVLGIITAALGVGLWQWTIARERHMERHAPARESDPFALIQAMQKPLAELRSKASSISTRAISANVDQLISQFIVPFTHVRHKVINQLGMRRGAEILVDFAIVERMLNRAWSAASDEFPAEAIASIEEASTVYAELQQRLASETSRG